MTTTQRLPLFQVDAFANTAFRGNPAAVVPLQQWPSDALMQAIAEENNLSETAFFAREGAAYRLRWFTPTQEVDLCGHATLAAAHVLCQHSGLPLQQLKFLTRSGELIVTLNDGFYEMDFPALPLEKVEAPESLQRGLCAAYVDVYAGKDYLVVLKDEQAVRALKPDFTQWLQLDRRGVIVTAPGDQCDFVSRCFFPKLRVNEDPVCGSAHCLMTPFWSMFHNKTSLLARQISARGGEIQCRIEGDRVFLKGQAVTYLIGAITVPTV
jgi:PhzF family phenazine biosynthesis protein